MPKSKASLIDVTKAPWLPISKLKGTRHWRWIVFYRVGLPYNSADVMPFSRNSEIPFGFTHWFELADVTQKEISK